MCLKSVRPNAVLPEAHMFVREPFMDAKDQRANLCPGLVLLQMSILDSGERVVQARPREGAPPSHTTGDNRRTNYIINSRLSNLVPDALQKNNVHFSVTSARPVASAHCTLSKLASEPQSQRLGVQG
jgi:hypothetical protein